MAGREEEDLSGAGSWKVRDDMGKTVLVMEMPNSCSACMASGMSDDCMVACKSVGEHRYSKSKPDWCPLISLPERKQNACSHGFAAGWNACLEVIKGNGGMMECGIWMQV